MEPLEDRVLDGNAIGGLLIEVFGTEMTAATSTCGFCGASGPVAELAVYRPGLGTVVRCRHCQNVAALCNRAPPLPRRADPRAFRSHRVWTAPRAFPA